MRQPRFTLGADRPIPTSRRGMERVMGIGPTQSAWKADILPLNYTRTNAEMQSQKITSTFQCLTILPYRTIDVKKNERLSQFLYLLTPSKTAIALIPLHCPITYPTHRYKHMQSTRFRTMWAVQFIDEAYTQTNSAVAIACF